MKVSNFPVFSYILVIISISVTFSVASSPKLAPFISHRSANVGSRFKIFCQVEEGTREGLIFQWTKNGKKVQSNLNDDHRQIIETSKDESTLTIDHLQPSDGGNYSCLVKMSTSTSTISDHQTTLLTVKGLRAILFSCISFGQRHVAQWMRQKCLLIQKMFFIFVVVVLFGAGQTSAEK